jgi:hypothetical protein
LIYTALNLGATTGNFTGITGNLNYTTLNLGATNLLMNVTGTSTFQGTTGNINYTNTNINAAGNLTLTGSTITLNGTINIPEYTEQQWIPYRLFDIVSTSNASIAQTQKELISSIPNFYWNFSVPQTGTFDLIYDITQNMRNVSTKGYKISKVYVNYEITGDAIVGISANVIQNTISTGGVRTPSLLTVDNTTLSSSTAIGKYYVPVLITNTYNSFDKNLVLDITVTKNTNSTLKFYGVTFEMTRS